MSDITNNRPSLTTDLETRYKTQKVGGAYDAKGPQPDMFGIQEKFWTKPGFVSKEELGTGGKKKIEDSLYRQGFDNKKYKG